MSGGFGEAAAVASFVSLALQLFDGCVKGFVLLSAAQGLGSRGDALQCRLKWEHYRLSSWARAVGLFRTPAELNVPISTIPIVENTLSNLQQLLTGATKLKQDYGLDVDVTEEELEAVRAPQRFFGRVLDKLKPQFVNDTARVYSRRNGVWKKLKWATIHADRLGLMLDDIRLFNENLYTLLSPPDQLATTVTSDALMRSIIAQSAEKDLREMFGNGQIAGPLTETSEAIAASARLRQEGLLLEVFDTPSVSSTGSPRTSSSSLPTATLSHDFRRLSPAQGNKKHELQGDSRLLCGSVGQFSTSVYRELGQYDGKTVVVEWKDIERAAEPRLKYRVANVAGLLAKMQDPAFHSLTCSSFIKHRESGRYAYLFDTPEGVKEAAAAISMKSLDDLLSATHRPALGIRLKMAVALVETVLQLHTSGWLHKSIRADNLIFFQPQVAAWDTEEALPRSYLGGYEFARLDAASEMTEEPRANGSAKMYRHPLSLGQGRLPYDKTFDLYSLGCVLLEIGFWRPVEDILLRWIRPEDSSIRSDADATQSGQRMRVQTDDEYFQVLDKKEELLQATGRGSIHARLAFSVGEAYSDVVRRCICAADHASGNALSDSFDSLDVHLKSLATLQRLAAIV